MRAFRSHAKLNLHLEVVRRRPDGYHDLRTIFQTVDLHDELRLERRRSAGIELVVAGADLPADHRNLAWRAAESFLARFGARGDGVRIELDKRIPMQSGLGGGSSNAATVLRALHQLWPPAAGGPERETALAALALELGADVPYFLLGGACLGAGRGDDLRALPDCGSPRAADGLSALWVACPPFGLSTAEVFARVEPRQAGSEPPGLARALGGEAVPFDDLVGENDLEAPAFALRPELGALYTSLVRAGARRVRMTGSGSALFALYDDPAQARAAGDVLPSGSAWMQVSTLGRARWRRESGFDPLGGG